MLISGFLAEKVVGEQSFDLAPASFISTGLLVCDRAVLMDGTFFTSGRPHV
jgi:hypothetical protein